MILQKVPNRYFLGESIYLVRRAQVNISMCSKTATLIKDKKKVVIRRLIIELNIANEDKATKAKQMGSQCH